MTVPPVSELSLNTDAVLLRPESLAALRALDPGNGNGFVLRVLTAYLSSLDRYLADLHTAQQGGDARTVKLVAHSLKSSSHHVGAIGFAEACAALERSLGTAGLEDPAVQGLLAQVLAQAPQVRTAVQETAEGAARS